MCAVLKLDINYPSKMYLRTTLAILVSRGEKQLTKESASRVTGRRRQVSSLLLEITENYTGRVFN